jgi:hypothetical protein
VRPVAVIVATASLICDGAASSAPLSAAWAVSTAFDGSSLRSFSTPASAWFTSSNASQNAVGWASAAEVVAVASALPSSSPPHAPSTIVATAANAIVRAHQLPRKFRRKTALLRSPPTIARRVASVAGAAR